MSNTMKPGEFCWNELMTSDVNKSKEFYSKLFDWTCEDHDMGHMTYTMIKKDGKDVGGMMSIPQSHEQEIPPHWMSYVLVDDVAESVKLAKSLGANIKQEPIDVANFGKLAVIQDPAGAHIAIWQTLVK